MAEILAGSKFTTSQAEKGWLAGKDTGNIRVSSGQVEWEKKLIREVFEKSKFGGMGAFDRLVGTDQWKSKMFGGGGLKPLYKGVIADNAEGLTVDFGARIDSPQICRSKIAFVEEFFKDYDYQKEMRVSHAREITKFIDPLTPLMAVKGSQITAKQIVVDANGSPTGANDLNGGWYDQSTGAYRVSGAQAWTSLERDTPKGHKGGTAVELFDVNDEYDWRKISEAILRISMNLMLNDIDMDGSDGYLWLDPVIYNVLMRNEDHLNLVFDTVSDNVHTGRAVSLHGVPIRTTNRLPKVGDVGKVHPLSNAANGFSYNTTLQDALCIAVWFAKNSVKRIKLFNTQSFNHYQELDHARYLDDIICVAAAPNEIQYTAAIFRKLEGNHTKALLEARYLGSL